MHTVRLIGAPAKSTVDVRAQVPPFGGTSSQSVSLPTPEHSSVHTLACKASFGSIIAWVRHDVEPTSDGSAGCPGGAKPRSPSHTPTTTFASAWLLCGTHERLGSTAVQSLCFAHVV